MRKKTNILFLSPHTDDVELGCGATISKLSTQNSNIFYLAFSDCQQSLKKKYDKNILRKECLKSSKHLGIKEKNIRILDYKVRNFSTSRQDILEEMIKIRNYFKPHIVYTTSATDTHQDHQVIYKESLRAFKFFTIISYELPWNDKYFEPNFFVDLSKNNINKKIQSLNYYKSQSHKAYFNSEYLKSHAIFRGVQNNSKYAEAFKLVNVNNKYNFFNIF